MLYRTLGKTGEHVSAIGLGGFHIGKPADAGEATRIIRAAIDAGITFMDNCWDYHEGESERRMGEALKGGYRQKVFLRTKLDGQTKAAAAAQLEQSLRRLQTDMIDLVQLHEIIRPEDPDRIFAPGGAIEALVEARQAGKLRYIGFTGHKDPSIHLKMLAQPFDWDTVQLPVNCFDAHFRSFTTEVVPVLVERGIGVLGMKPLASGRIMQAGAATAEECLRFALSQQTSVVITGCESMDNLEQAVRVAEGFQPMSAAEQRTLLDRTLAAAKAGEHELYKTTDVHDGTKKNPQWLTAA